MTDRNENDRFVLVTDQHRTVWCGYTDQDGPTPEDTITLREMRHVYYFDTSEGIGELAQSGPGRTAKIGDVIPEAVVNEVSVVMETTNDAEERFASQGWGKRRE